ncbi:MAG: diacylglycerol kinase family lipid kinase [Caldilineaceae bacterium]
MSGRAYYTNIYVIINPAAGQDVPVLATLNTVFREAGVRWHAMVTHEAGDGYRLATEAIAAGADVVAAYGGDGTVAEVASALIDTDIPLAILPGGTANVLSLELGIPGNLTQAARLACGVKGRLRKIDAGDVNGQHFLLRVGIGFEASLVTQADRQLKERLGFFAYVWSGMRNLRHPPKARYRMVLDGKEVECDGVTCGIANSGNLGQPGIKLGKAVDVSDGLLDVLLVEQASVQAVVNLLGSIFGIRETPIENTAAQFATWNSELQQHVRHWQAREISLSVAPRQPIQYDGEVLNSLSGEIVCKVLPKALTVIVPA